MRPRVADVRDLEPMPLWEVSQGLCPMTKNATFRRRVSIKVCLHVASWVLFRMPLLTSVHPCLAFTQDDWFVAVLDFNRTANPWGLDAMSLAPRLSRPTNGRREAPGHHRCAVGARLADGLERASRRGR